MSEIDPRDGLVKRLRLHREYLIGVALISTPGAGEVGARASAMSADLGAAIDVLSIQPAKLKAEPVDEIHESRCEYCGDLNWQGPSNNCRVSSGHSWQSTGRTLFVYASPIPEQAGVGVKGLDFELDNLFRAYDHSDIPTHFHSHAPVCDAMAALRRARAALIPASPTEPVEGDVAYLMSVIDAAIEDGFSPDEDGPLLDEIRASIAPSSPPASGEREGFVSVPREPTLAMSIAGEAEYQRKGLGLWSDFHAIYRAMIAAAPNARDGR